MAAHTSKLEAEWKVSPEHEKAWRDEIADRLARAMSGQAELISLESAIERLRKPRL